MDDNVLLETSMHKVITRRQALLAAGTFLGGFALGACSRSSVRDARHFQYTVQSGDTLSQLSRRSGLSIKDIIEANKLRSKSLEVGQRLTLPGVRTLGPDPLLVIKAPVHSCKIITRDEWGALPMKSNHDPMSLITRITVHHTHEIPGMMHRSDREIVKAIARYHRNTLQWADIGYHYLIGRDGYVYEGRPVMVQGAHARGANNLNNLGIAVIGDFNDHLPDEKQLTTLQNFLIDMQKTYHVANKDVFGHYQFVNTECPGRALKGWLQDYVKNTHS